MCFCCVYIIYDISKHKHFASRVTAFWHMLTSSYSLLSTCSTLSSTFKVLESIHKSTGITCALCIKSNALMHHSRIPEVTWKLPVCPPIFETGLEIIFQFFCQIQNISLSRFGEIVNYNLRSCSWSMEKHMFDITSNPIAKEGFWSLVLSTE